jgi:hypothetical protein
MRTNFAIKVFENANTGKTLPQRKGREKGRQVDRQTDLGETLESRRNSAKLGSNLIT